MTSIYCTTGGASEAKNRRGQAATAAAAQECKNAAYRAHQGRRAVLSPVPPLAAVGGVDHPVFARARPRGGGGDGVGARQVARGVGRWHRPGRGGVGETVVEPGQYVVELGGGTGSITMGLIERGIPRDLLVVIELDGPMHSYPKERPPAGER